MAGEKIAAFHVANEINVEAFEQRQGIARERIALVLLFADREQTDARPFDAQHQARVDLAHQRELLEHLRFAVDIGAHVDHHHRSAFLRREHAGKRGTVHPRNLAQQHLRDGHAGTGVAGGNEAVRFTRGSQPRADVHGTFPFAARRFGSVVVHGDAVGGVHHFDLKLAHGMRFEGLLDRVIVAH